MRRLFQVILLLICVLTSTPARAQIGMAQGVALSPFPVAQNPAAYVTFPDSGGGVWAVFQGADPHSGLYVTHVNPDGSFAPGFNANARRIARDSSQVNNVTASPDGLGGVIIAWFGTHPKDSNGTLIALRMIQITYDGTYTTRDTGVVVSTIATAAACAGDGNGGGYVVWEELKGTSNPDIVAQHYATGFATWIPSGSPTGRNVCATVGIQRLRAVHSDGTGGAYVVWADSRTPSTTPLYAMHLTPDGVDAGGWTTNGVRLTAVSSTVRFVGSSVSPAGGLWVAWRDFNVATATLGQHVAVNGALRWGASGALMATVSPLHVDFVPASNGHVFVNWGGNDIRCARLDSVGTRLWSESAGRVLVAPLAPTDVVRVAADGAGGQRLMWSWDNAGQLDINVLAVDGAGAPRAGEPAGGSTIESGSATEYAVAWFSADNVWPVVAWLENGILRLRQLLSGTVGVGPVAAGGTTRLAAPYPNPSRPGQSPTLRFNAPAGNLRLSLYDAAGRRRLTRMLSSAGGAQTHRLDEALRLAPGVYTVTIESNSGFARQRMVRLQ